MSLQVEKLEHNMAKLTVEVAAEDVEKALQAAYLKQRKQINIPGFRKGKVPRQMIEKMYGPEVFYDEAANNMIPDAYAKAYDESELDIVSQPKIEVVQMEKGKPFIFTAEVATKPEVTLGDYKGLKVDKVSTRVTQKEVDEEIEKERERNARTIEVTDRAVQDKDEVTLDFEGFVDGATFKCTVHTIKAKELPELDDEFASEVSECETMDAYRAEVKKNIKERKERTGKEKKENQAVDQAIENAQMDIPEAMIEFQVRQMADDFARRIQQQGLTVEQYFQFTGMTAEKMMEEMRPQAEKSIKTRLVLEAIVKAENIEVSDERVEEELTKMAEAYQMEVEKLKEFMGENEKKQIKEDLAVQEAITLLVNESVEG